MSRRGDGRSAAVSARCPENEGCRASRAAEIGAASSASNATAPTSNGSKSSARPGANVPANHPIATATGTTIKTSRRVRPATAPTAPPRARIRANSARRRSVIRRAASRISPAAVARMPACTTASSACTVRTCRSKSASVLSTLLWIDVFSGGVRRSAATARVSAPTWSAVIRFSSSRNRHRSVRSLRPVEASWAPGWSVSITPSSRTPSSGFGQPPVCSSWSDQTGSAGFTGAYRPVTRTRADPNWAFMVSRSPTLTPNAVAVSSVSITSIVPAEFGARPSTIFATCEASGS